MLRTFLVLFLGSVVLQAQSTVILPAGVHIRDVASDLAGDLYLAGQKENRAYLAKVAGAVVTEVPVSAEGSAFLASITVDSAGSVYIAGTEFGEGRSQAFVHKYDANGALQFATLLDRPAYTSARSLAVNPAGEALLNGHVSGPGFPVTTGTPQGAPDRPGGFVVKLDRGGRIMFSIRGTGAGLVAFDRQDSIYVAGTDATLPLTPGAFQQEHLYLPCAGTGFFGFLCAYQHVAKISSDGMQLIYSTFVTGSHGATPAALQVSGSGEVTLAGTTNSPDYPTTEGTFQPAHRATARGKITGVPVKMPIIPPAKSGFITRLSADGSGLIWSTFFSGTGADSITDLIAGPEGELIVAGLAGSRDLPLSPSFPEGCSPLLGREVPYVSYLNLDGSQLRATKHLWEIAGTGGELHLAAKEGSLVVAAGDKITPVPSDTDTVLTCVTDPADSTYIGRVAPDQIVSIYGLWSDPDAVSASYNELPLTILSRSPERIDVKALADFSNGGTVNLTLRSGDESRTRLLASVERAPSAFLSERPFGVVSPGAVCQGGGFSPAFLPLARNEDGELNTCERPAVPGSAITILLNGVGKDTPDFSLRYPDLGQIESAQRQPDSSPGQWQLRIRLNANARSSALVPLVNGQPLRYGWLAIWIAR